MATTDEVMVFNFTEFRLGSDAPSVSSYKATRETIETKLGSTVLEGTAETVPSDALDADGRYRRVATGWGELLGS